jgi:hypothetical protein
MSRITTAWQTKISGRNQRERIPTIGEPENVWIRWHQIHFELSVTPSTDRSIRRHVTFEAEPCQLLLHSMICRKRGYRRDQIYIESYPHGRCSGVGN